MVITSFLHLFNLDIFPKIFFAEKDINEIINLLNHDKKNFDGRINFVLLKEIGKPEVDMQVPTNTIKKGFDFYQL